MWVDPRNMSMFFAAARFTFVWLKEQSKDQQLCSRSKSIMLTQHTVDGLNPATTNNDFNHGFKLARTDFVHPHYVLVEPNQIHFPTGTAREAPAVPVHHSRVCSIVYTPSQGAKGLQLFCPVAHPFWGSSTCFWLWVIRNALNGLPNRSNNKNQKVPRKT